MLRAMLLLAAAGVSSGVVPAAEIHRCIGASGEPSFSHRPGAAATILSMPTSVPEAQPAQGLRASERAWLEGRERRAAPQKRPRSRSATAGAPAKKQAYRCRNKYRALQDVKAKLRRGYRASQGDKLRRRRRAHEDYLATFCS